MKGYRIRIDLSGKVFGRLVVKHPMPKIKNQHLHWLCVCECGKQKIIDGGSLRYGLSNSCGCLQKQIVSKMKTTHGEAHIETREYTAWQNMRARCYRKKASNYSYYGGRGIRVCARWRFSYENFLADMGRRPSPAHSLDREDANGNYTPDNCRWATKSVQSANQRRWQKAA